MSPWCKELSDPPQNCQQCHCCCLKTPKEQNARAQNDVCLQLIPKKHFLFRLRGTISAQTLVIMQSSTLLFWKYQRQLNIQHW